MPLSHVVFNAMSKFELESQRDRTNINLDRVIKSGNGRRLMDMPVERRRKVPNEVVIKDTPTTHEITLEGVGASYCDGRIIEWTPDYAHDGRAYVQIGTTTYECMGNCPANGKQSSIDAYMCHISGGEELVGRKRYTKIICTKDEGQPRRFFYVMVWTDFFGASVQEGELARRSKTSRTFYTREETDPDKVRMLSESVTSFLDQFAPRHPNQAAPELDPEWLTSTVLALADQALKYDQGVYPILADALQDAGCDNDEMLTHFRDPDIYHHANCWWMTQFYKTIRENEIKAAGLVTLDLGYSGQSYDDLGTVNVPRTLWEKYCDEDTNITIGGGYNGGYQLTQAEKCTDDADSATTLEELVVWVQDHMDFDSGGYIRRGWFESLDAEDAEAIALQLRYPIRKYAGSAD